MLSRANVVDFSDWIVSQAKVYDEFRSGTSKTHSAQPEGNPRVRHGSHATGCSPSTRSYNNDYTARSSTSCVMADSGPHKLYNCSKFKNNNNQFI